PQLAHIPVLLLTDTAEADQARAASAGSDGVLGKPLDPHAVIARVKELLAKPRRAQAPGAPSHAPAMPMPPRPVPTVEPVFTKTRAVPAANPFAPVPPIAPAPAPPTPIAAAPVAPP